jgi:hypothetical protein
MNNVFLVCWIVFLLYVLLETDAIPKWGKFLRLKFLKYQEYEKSCAIFGSLAYRHFLLSKYPNFFVFLFACQECLAVWFTIFGYAAFYTELGGWKTFGITVIGSWVGIAFLKWILKKLYV